ncbi:beta-lactamase family protein [Sphingobacterium sp. SRCM116780]|uniref:serine hydrolase domain-containing protein n=1 Tax=Sphingobacterium sp. SRCM116780 TaxID=2907623 RepID=UPI001F30EF2C|nr:serine hydrolase domain-containing protein [Sphingobacterium sp. SRCM116780]UIR56863.1 beta-lactamase family protein [Sphingobacterium sp. SRCM116780]
MKQLLKFKRSSYSIAAILLFLIGSILHAQAQQAGFNKERLLKIDEVINRQIAAHHIPGATALIIRNGEVVYNKAFGYADIGTKRKMKTDDIFRIASQSKAITSLAVMMLWEDGKFLLDDPISNYIPAFKNPKVLVDYHAKDGSYTTKPANREITVRDLLRHTSGIAYPAIFSDPTMWRIYEEAGIPSGIGTIKSTSKEKMELLATLPLQHHPGERFTYGLNIDLLGYLIEIWSGQSLEAFLKQRVLEPLEMNDTYFHIPKEKQDRLVTLYETAENGNLLQVEHPLYEGVDPLFPKQNGSYLSGGAGLSATTADMAKFYSLYLNKGMYKNKRIIGSKTIALMLTNQLNDDVKISPLPPQPENFQFSLGGFAVVTEKNHYLSPQSIGAFGWGGAFNTHGWADPKEGIIALLFTQEYLSPWFSIGEEFQVAVYQAIKN